jgi:RNA polymerase sigma-70 factor, ECF subfamily
MVRLRKKTTKEIIEELKHGLNQESNYRLLFERHYDQVYRFFQRKGMYPEDCRDLTQEVFVAVHRGLNGLREAGQFQNWLFKIAKNIFTNDLERRLARKREGRELSLEAPDSKSEELRTAARKVTDPKASPMEALLEKERRHKLSQAIEELPPQMRRSVQLRVMKGLSYAEIAAVMGLSTNTVKAHLHQARKVLREGLGQYFNDMEL